MLSASDCLKVVGVLGQQRPEPRLEVPGPQRAEGVVGLGKRRGAPRRPSPRPTSKTAAAAGDHRRDLGVHLEDAAEVGRERDPQPGEGAGDRRREHDAGVAERLRRPRVGAGHHRQQQREVADVAGHRAADRGGLPLVVRAATSGTRPSEGRSPTTPQNDAGLRSEPPMSRAVGERHHAGRRARTPRRPRSRPPTAVGSTGLSVVPKTVLKVCDPAANSGTLVLPMTTTPAPRTRSTSRSSASGTWSANSGEPYVVRQPATAWVSLNANGSPCSGPDVGAGRQRLVGRRRARRGRAPRRARRSR